MAKLGDKITDGTVQWQVRKAVTLPYELPGYMETLLDDGDAATARSTLGAPSTTGANASGNWNINAATATKLATARTIALSGDATGSATFDGSGDSTITVTVSHAASADAVAYIPDCAASHNGIYRGKDLTTYFTSGGMSTAIADGTFKDIYIGDYIDVPMTVNGTSIGTVRWRVGECDYFYRHYGADTTHHVLMVPDDVLNVQTRMNASNDTTGGYCASEMYTTTLPLYVTAIQNAFGTDHVLAHNELLTTAISADAPSAAGAGWTGSASGWDWKTVTANLFNEVMVYGTTAFSSSGFDVGNSKTQVALFHLNQTATIAGYRGNYNDKKWYWLRSIASSSKFCGVHNTGYALSANAAFQSDWVGIRPYFLLR